jgi:hypothetical protein
MRKPAPSGWPQAPSCPFYRDAVEPGRGFRPRHASPPDVGGRVTQALCQFVDDDGSDRGDGAQDREGHAWWFMHRVRDRPAR